MVGDTVRGAQRVRQEAESGREMPHDADRRRAQHRSVSGKLAEPSADPPRTHLPREVEAAADGKIEAPGVAESEPRRPRAERRLGERGREARLDCDEEGGGEEGVAEALGAGEEARGAGVLGARRPRLRREVEKALSD